MLHASALKGIPLCISNSPIAHFYKSLPITIMNVHLQYRRIVKSFGAGILLLCLVGLFQEAVAQGAQGRIETKWLEVGDHAHRYTNTGSYGLAGSGNLWPQLRTSAGVIRAYHDGERMWLGVKNWTDTTGNTWEYKFSYTERGNNLEDVFVTDFYTVCRSPEPEVLVDLLPSQRFEITCDEIDPDMGPARKLVNVINTNIGVTIRKEILAFSQQYHDDYHIIDITLTNTGNVDGDEDIELPDQQIEGLYLWHDRRWGQTWQTSDVIGRGSRWGDWNLQDVVNESDLKAYLSWQGWSPELQDWNPIGAPAFDSEGGSFVTGEDKSGQLHGIGWVNNGHIRADVSAEDDSDSPDQPRTFWWLGANTANATGSPPDDTNPDVMRQHYEDWFEVGVKRPTPAEIICPSGDYAHCYNDPDITSGGRRVALGYGPYDLDPGESVNIVMVEGVTGLTYEAGRVIGAKAKEIWERTGNAQSEDIEYDADHDGTIESDEVMDKNEWVMTGRDSALMMQRRAIANYESGYQIPKAPEPPSSFHVTSTGGGIQLEWEYPNSGPPGGFEIYRTNSYYQGNPTDDFKYRKIDRVGSDVREYFDDTDVQRGIKYFYYITALGEVNQDSTGMTPTGTRLRSSRYYTQTYQQATSQREPGESLSEARIVPNPYHAGQSSGTEGVRFSDTPEVRFFDIPGNATIEIFTERGDLVRTIEHTDGTGDETWNLQTRGEQPVASGIYLVSIQDNETGDRRLMKLIVIR